MSSHPWPSEKEIEVAHRTRPFDRNWSKFDLPDPLCDHNRCEWNEAGTLLRCTTCGIDGT